jgi:hypothetical protein
MPTSPGRGSELGQDAANVALDEARGGLEHLLSPPPRCGNRRLNPTGNSGEGERAKPSIDDLVHGLRVPGRDHFSRP